MQNVMWMLFETAANIFQSFLTVHFIIGSFDNKCKILNVKKTHIIGTVVMAAVVTLLNNFTIYEGILGVLYSLSFFIFAYAFLYGSVIKKIFIGVLTNLCLLFSTMIVGNVLFYFLRSEPHKIYTEHCFERFLYIIISSAFMTYIFAILKNLTRSKKDSLKTKEWLLILSVLSISFFIVAILQVLILTENIGRENLNLLMLSEFGMILINILCFYITVNLNETHKREEQLIIDKRRSEYNQQYAETVKEQYNQTRRLRHDLKQYAGTVLALLNDGKTDAAREIAEEQCESLSKIETVINTGNDFLNAILNSKLSLAKSTGIDVLCSVENDISGIEDIDLCSLIGNLLDNAIAAAEKCGGELRLIEVKISSVKSRFIVVVRNSIPRSVLEENPKLKSTKSDAVNHGFGIKTIKYIAEKYNGKFDFYEEGLTFVSRVELRRVVNDLDFKTR